MHRCVRRLTACGLTRRLRARATEDDPGVLKVKQRKDEDRWVRCLKLMREPKETDRQAFMSEGRRTEKESGAEKVGDDNDAESDDDMATLEAMDAVDDSQSVILPSQWTPDLHYSNLVYRVIETHGPQGISSMDLSEHAASRFYRRPLDEIMAKLTDLWHRAQPPHLRHLAIVRDTNVQGTTSHYVFRTYGNFQQAVAIKQASWDYVLADAGAARALQTSADLDQWGFPKVDRTEIINSDGYNGITQCVPSSQGQKRKGRRATAEKSVKRRRVLDPEVTLAIENTPDHIATHVPATANRSIQRRSLEVETVRRQEIPPAPARMLAPGFAAKRQAREAEQWQTRAQRLAESLAQEEVQQARTSASAKAAAGATV